MIAVIILAIVFIFIAVRQVGKFRFDIWAVMAGGAVLSMATGQISLPDAYRAVNLDVILFLFGMFVVGAALEESGYLSHLSYELFKRAKDMKSLLLYILFGFGILSGIVMNDTIAIIGVPVVLLLAKKHKIRPKFVLLALAFAVTIGSVFSPIGNPQNLLIALDDGIDNPFITFIKYLFIPSMLNLFVAYILLRIFYHNDFRNGIAGHSQEPIKDHRLAFLSKISLLIIVSMIALRISLFFFGIEDGFRLTYIALLGMLPIVLFSGRRLEMIGKADWHTLIFFISMFILMQSVWDSGFFQAMISGTEANLLSLPIIFIVSIAVSQFVSNVPLVALYMPMLSSLGATPLEMAALAAGSTIAGNLLILGAASNIIIIQNAEKRGSESISFIDFAKVGIPLTIANMLVYWGYLSLF